MSRPLRVLQVIDSLARAGAEQSLATLAPRLVAEGIDLHVAYLVEREGLRREIERAGVPVVSLGSLGARAPRLVRPGDRARGRAAARRRAHDAVRGRPRRPAGRGPPRRAGGVELRQHDLRAHPGRARERQQSAAAGRPGRRRLHGPHGHPVPRRDRARGAGHEQAAARPPLEDRRHPAWPRRRRPRPAVARPHERGAPPARRGPRRPADRRRRPAGTAEGSRRAARRPARGAGAAPQRPRRRRRPRGPAPRRCSATRCGRTTWRAP